MSFASPSCVQGDNRRYWNLQYPNQAAAPVLPPPRSYYVVSWVPRALPEVVELIKEIPSPSERYLISDHFELGMLVMRRCGVHNSEEIKCLLDGFREGTTRLSSKDPTTKHLDDSDHLQRHDLKSQCVTTSSGSQSSSGSTSARHPNCTTPATERRKLLIFFNNHRASRPWVLCPAKHCIKSARTTGKVKGRVKIFQYDQSSASVRVPKLFMDCLSDFMTHDRYVFATFCPQQKYTDHELEWFDLVNQNDRTSSCHCEPGGDIIYRELIREIDARGGRAWPFEDYIIFSNSRAKIVAVFKKKDPYLHPKKQSYQHSCSPLSQPLCYSDPFASQPHISSSSSHIVSASSSYDDMGEHPPSVPGTSPSKSSLHSSSATAFVSDQSFAQSTTSVSDSGVGDQTTKFGHPFEDFDVRAMCWATSTSKPRGSVPPSEDHGLFSYGKESAFSHPNHLPTLMYPGMRPGDQNAMFHRGPEGHIAFDCAPSKALQQNLALQINGTKTELGDPKDPFYQHRCTPYSAGSSDLLVDERTATFANDKHHAQETAHPPQTSSRCLLSEAVSHPSPPVSTSAEFLDPETLKAETQNYQPSGNPYAGSLSATAPLALLHDASVPLPECVSSSPSLDPSLPSSHHPSHRGFEPELPRDTPHPQSQAQDHTLYPPVEMASSYHPYPLNGFLGEYQDVPLLPRPGDLSQSEAWPSLTRHFFNHAENAEEALIRIMTQILARLDPHEDGGAALPSVMPHGCERHLGKMNAASGYAFRPPESLNAPSHGFAPAQVLTHDMQVSSTTSHKMAYQIGMVHSGQCEQEDQSEALRRATLHLQPHVRDLMFSPDQFAHLRPRGGASLSPTGLAPQIPTPPIASEYSVSFASPEHHQSALPSAPPRDPLPYAGRTYSDGNEAQLPPASGYTAMDPRQEPRAFDSTQVHLAPGQNQVSSSSSPEVSSQTSYANPHPSINDGDLVLSELSLNKPFGLAGEPYSGFPCSPQPGQDSVYAQSQYPALPMQWTSTGHSLCTKQVSQCASLPTFKALSGPLPSPVSDQHQNLGPIEIPVSSFDFTTDQQSHQMASFFHNAPPPSDVGVPCPSSSCFLKSQDYPNMSDFCSQFHPHLFEQPDQPETSAEGKLPPLVHSAPPNELPQSAHSVNQGGSMAFTSSSSGTADDIAQAPQQVCEFPQEIVSTTPTTCPPHVGPSQSPSSSFGAESHPSQGCSGPFLNGYSNPYDMRTARLYPSNWDKAASFPVAFYPFEKMQYSYPEFQCIFPRVSSFGPCCNQDNGRDEPSAFPTGQWCPVGNADGADSSSVNHDNQCLGGRECTLDLNTTSTQNCSSSGATSAAGDPGVLPAPSCKPSGNHDNDCTVQGSRTAFDTVAPSVDLKVISGDPLAASPGRLASRLPNGPSPGGSAPSADESSCSPSLSVSSQNGILHEQENLHHGSPHLSASPIVGPTHKEGFSFALNCRPSGPLPSPKASTSNALFWPDCSQHPSEGKSTSSQVIVGEALPDRRVSSAAGNPQQQTPDLRSKMGKLSGALSEPLEKSSLESIFAFEDPIGFKENTCLNPCSHKDAFERETQLQTTTAASEPWLLLDTTPGTVSDPDKGLKLDAGPLKPSSYESPQSFPTVDASSPDPSECRCAQVPDPPLRPREDCDTCAFPSAHERCRLSVFQTTTLPPSSAFNPVGPSEKPISLPLPSPNCLIQHIMICSSAKCTKSKRKPKPPDASPPSILSPRELLNKTRAKPPNGLLRQKRPHPQQGSRTSQTRRQRCNAVNL